MPFTRKRSLAEPDLNKGSCPRQPGKGVRGRKKEKHFDAKIDNGTSSSGGVVCVSTLMGCGIFLDLG